MRRYGWIVISLIILSVTACTSSEATYNNRGNDVFAEAAYDDALEEYTAAKEANPDLAEPYYNSGNAYHNKGDLKSAIEQGQQALQLADDSLAQRAFYNLGNTYFLQEDWPAAIKNYEEALLLDPNDKQSKYNLELALRTVQQQQQDGQPQPGDQPQPGEGPPGEEGEPQPQGEGEEEQPGGSGGDQQDEEGSGGDEQSDQEGKGKGELTKKEAEQLLDNLSQNSQTLQERLNRSFDGQNRRRPPAQDW